MRYFKIYTEGKQSSSQPRRMTTMAPRKEGTADSEFTRLLSKRKFLRFE